MTPIRWPASPPFGQRVAALVTDVAVVGRRFRASERKDRALRTRTVEEVDGRSMSKLHQVGRWNCLAVVLGGYPRQLLAELAMVNPTLLIAAQVGQSRPFDKSAVSHRVAVVWLLAAGASPELPGAGSVLLDQLYPRCQAHLRWSTATFLEDDP